jgi:hypothetical protein
MKCDIIIERIYRFLVKNFDYYLLVLFSGVTNLEDVSLAKYPNISTIRTKNIPKIF